LAGRPLRSELYARDGDAEREDRPYTVTEHRYGVTAILDGRPAGEWAAAPVVFAHPVDERVSQWERGDDPMHHFTFTGGYDQYGRPRVHAEAGIPRGHDPHAGTGDGSAGRILMTATATGYATRDDGGGYLLNRAVSVTRLQVLDDGKAGVSGLWASFAAGTATATVLGHQVSHYDGDPFTGLSYGQVGDRGLVSREAQLVHTDASLAAAFPAGLPPYLDPDAAWPAGAGPEYPPEFRESVPHGAGYRRHVGEPGYEDGWYAETGSAYDGRGNVVTARDTQGNDTSVAYDRSGLLPVAVTDPGGMTTTAAYDYRVLQPSLTTDVNGNRTAYWYTPLGLLATVALLGRPGEQTGDTPGQPGLRYEYGLSAYDDRPASPRQPLWVHTTQRVQHRWDLVADENERRATAGQPPLTDEEISALFPADERDASPERFLRTQEYSDGFGRPLQTRAQADDIVLDDLGLPVDPDTPAGDAVTYRQPPSEDPQVAVSGWQTYDNKGRVVEKFEPLFGTGWNYAQPIPPGTSTDPTGPRSLAGVMIELGPPRSTMYYDPPGRLVRTVRPDGSVQLAVHGVPAALADPAHYRPTPWELYQYDGNDNAGRTHPAESASYSGHWNTPASHVVDALGRVIEAVQRIDSRTLVTRTSYDIDGNATEITDPLGRTASRNAFDLLKRAWRTELLDAGAAHIILDPAGGMAEHRDAKGAITLTAYDALHRPVRVWAGDRAGDPVTLRELTRYGDAEPGLTREAAAAANLLGRVHQAYDEAGRVTTASYDLQGHATETERRVLRTDILLGGLPSGSGDWTGTAYRADWSGPGIDGLLDPVGYAVSSRFDAAGRRTQVTGPAGEGDGRVTLTATYSRAGHLATVAVDGLPYLRESLYDATGKRLLAVLANGVMTRYAYDEHTFRLARLRSEVCLARPGDFAGWRPAGTVHQDHGYQYDLVGNLVALLDRTPGCGVAPGDPNRLARQFRYDPLYRLLAASGRECQASAPPPPWTDIPRCTDVTSTRPYSESYSYDDAGGLLQIAHTGLTGGYTRDLIPAPGSNRLATLDTAGISYAYTYDPAGNLSTETASRHHEWDHANRLATFRSQPLGSAAEPSVYAQYRYDASGQRVVKARRNQGGALAVTVYIGDLFERLVVTSASGAQTTHDTVHVSDMGARIATRRIGQPAPGDSAPPLTFQLGDHLGSVGVVLDDTGGLVNREEFTPFGETTFGSYTRKRYRFTGKERDEESGYSYHRARYYAPWLARWTSADPIGIADGLNRYAYVGNRPTVRVDHAGTEGHDPKQMFLSQAPAYRQMITATKTGRGIGQWLRDAYQKAAEMWGQPGPVDVGHLDKPHVLLRDGERAVTFAQDRSENRSQAGAERAAAADARAARRFARDSKGYDPTSPGGRNPRTPRNPALTSPEFKNWQPPTPPPPAAAPPPSVPAPAPVARPAPQQLDLDFSKPAATPPAPAGPVGGAGGTVAKVGSGLGSGLGSVGRFVLAHLPSLAGMALGHYSGKAANAIMTSGITLTPQQQEQHAIQMLPLGYAPPGVDILIAYDVRLLTDKFSSLFNDWDIGNLYGVPR
ncbi:MAG: hypothetical protein QOJ50_799, partial [Cryptosporangiaceae bacterium]|nr:hypothetical protein [Cryptosporangiaceae bacterium]